MLPVGQIAILSVQVEAQLQGVASRGMGDFVEKGLHHESVRRVRRRAPGAAGNARLHLEPLDPEILHDTGREVVHI